MSAPQSLAALEEEARRLVPAYIAQYHAYVAGSGHTVNVYAPAAFQRIRLTPRVMVDVSNVDTSIEVFGERFACPVMAAPTGQ